MVFEALLHAHLALLRLLEELTLLLLYQASLVAQRLKCLPAMQETWVRSLGWEDPLEKEVATHSSILAWRIPWTRESGGLQSMESNVPQIIIMIITITIYCVCLLASS